MLSGFVTLKGFGEHEPFKILFIIYLFIFRKRGKEEAREGEKHQRVRETLISGLLITPQLWTKPTTQPCVVTGNRTSNPLLYSSDAQQSHTSQGNVSHLKHLLRQVLILFLTLNILFSAELKETCSSS